jgi:hypothetical protein
MFCLMKEIAMRSMFLTVAMATLAAWANPVEADAVTDWNVHDGQFANAAGLGVQPANRLMAIAHTAAYEAASAVATRNAAAAGSPNDAPTAAAVDAAIAAAHRTVLARMLPTQRAAVDTAYEAALARIGDAGAKARGIAAGERAAFDVLERRAEDGALASEAYRPHTAPGHYVPTAIPAVPQWPQRKPWLMTNASMFRPGPPPALKGERWARDFNEIKALGARNSTARSAEQTYIARFWETTLPPIYHGIVRSVAQQTGRDVVRNARLFAAVTQGTDDALIAVFDAKYHYAFWRPITAIRNGDLDGNDATELEPAWTPLIDTPMHPEYPCAHCIMAGTVGAILRAEIGRQPLPPLTTASASANGATRLWTSIEAFVQEVSDARVWDGVHYRTSTEVGTDMGRRIGELAARRFFAD